MKASLRALLAGVVDYAGMFPPAKLPLDQAIRNYARYRQEPEAWMLGRFILPAALLVELEPYYEELIRPDPPFFFAVLGRGGNTVEEFLAGLADDLVDVISFRERNPETVVDAIELRLPPGFPGPEDPQAASQFFEQVHFRIKGAQVSPGLTPYFEVPPGPDWATRASAVIAALGVSNALAGTWQPPPGRPAGFKLRCGGLDDAAFPPAERVAAALVACRRAGVPLKATAGLHHPVRRPEPPMHGFLNLLAAGALAHARGLPEGKLIEVLEDQDPAHFSVTDEAFGWLDRLVGLEDIVKARLHAVLSFGSCSFDEPRDDLRALGWL